MRHKHRKPRPKKISSGVRSTSGKGAKSAGVQWLYGIHTVLAALANPQRRCRRLVVTPEARSAVGARLDELVAENAGRDGRIDSVEETTRAAISKLLPKGAVHQGVALKADPLPETSLAELCREAQSGGHGVAVILDQVNDPHNVGAVLRSAAAFGTLAVIVTERHAPEATSALAKAASGGLEKVPLVRVSNLRRAMKELKDNGFWCVGLDAQAGQSLADTPMKGLTALVLGAEGRGLRRLVHESCDLLARIPLEKGMDSLNVSNAAAIALYEHSRRS